MVAYRQTVDKAKVGFGKLGYSRRGSENRVKVQLIGPLQNLAATLLHPSS